MKKYYIFLDTNIIQHTLTHPEKEKLVGLHRMNADFYESGDLYILPQIFTELNELDDNIFDFKKSKYSFVETFDTTMLSDDLAFHTSFFESALSNIFQLSQIKIAGYKAYITDTFFFLESMYDKAIDGMSVLQEIKKILEKTEGITFNQDYRYNYSQALANVIEGTELGNMAYKNFTYRDIFRSTGNFMFDYKNYQNKGERQKSKVGKDAQVICELVIWMDFLNDTPIDGNIICISSDYDFIKEVKKFQTDCLTGKIFESQLYGELSTYYISQLKNVMKNLKMIKLDPQSFLFQNEKLSSHKIQEII